MTELLKDTEEKIFKAAEDVFTNKGMTGARMQEIADKANINKSLLHYYYRSKEKLFRAVFKTAFVKFIPKPLKIITSDISLFEKIEQFSASYIDMVAKNPSIPLFVLHELNRNPEGILSIMIDTMKDLDANPVESFKKSVYDEIEKGTIIEIDPRHLFVNMLSMCILPIAARAIIQRVGFSNDSAEYDKFLEERKKEVPQFIINSIKKR